MGLSPHDALGKGHSVNEGSPLRMHHRRTSGRIVIEIEIEPSLEQMLATFDPSNHGGEAMDGGPVGVEAFADEKSSVGSVGS